MLVQLCNLFMLETKLQLDRLLHLSRQVSCQRGVVSASSSPVFPRTCSLEKQEKEAKGNTFLQPLEHTGCILLILMTVPSHTIPVAGNPKVN